MNINTKNNLYLFGIHAVLSYISIYSPYIGMAWGVAIVAIGIYKTLKTRNQNNEAALFAAYFMSLEVVLRINKGSLSYEMGKYGVIILLLTGLFFEKRPHFLPRQFLTFIIVLLPAIFLVEMGDIELERKAILFNLSGPFTLAVSAIYFYNRKFTKQDVYNILLYIMLPAFSLGILLFFKTPDLSEIKFNTVSNSSLSGGFGPNQVSTMLGLGIFVGIFAFLMGLSLTGSKIVDLFIILFLTLRGLLTFSRGGVVAAILGLAAAIFFIMKYRQDAKLLKQIVIGGFLICIAGIGVWSYTNALTGGTLALRYQGKSMNDPNKVNFTAGRLEIIETELEAFSAYPILGTGVGMGRLFRIERGEEGLAAHTEYTRLLGEHGIYGFLALLILLISPLVHLFKVNKDTKPFLAGFIVVSLFTMFHAAMRLAMPGFIYGLAFISLIIDDQPDPETPTFPTYNPPEKRKLQDVF
ncbi:O-antigen ligase family protein [soil metagenome]